VDQYFAAAGKADQPLSSAGHGSRAHEQAAFANLGVLARDIWSLDDA
jgi:hypothetical protein